MGQRRRDREGNTSGQGLGQLKRLKKGGGDRRIGLAMAMGGAEGLSGVVGWVKLGVGEG